LAIFYAEDEDSIDDVTDDATVVVDGVAHYLLDPTQLPLNLHW
jgi:hypothetical protein